MSPTFVRPTLTCPHFLQGSTEGFAIKDFVLKHTLPLVGHRKPSNDAKRYTRRPLVVVYYSVDFSFDYRAGEGPGPGGWEVRSVFTLWLQVVVLLCSRQGLMQASWAGGAFDQGPLFTEVAFSEMLFSPRKA